MSNSIQQKLDLFEKTIAKLERAIFSDLVPWDSVKEWEVGLSKNISNTMNTLVYKEENVMIFETVIPPKGQFPHHWHDFQESNFVISGFYTNAAGLQEKGKWIRYESHEAHLVSNESEDIDLKIIVIFTKE